jgi:hypothetical protein
VNRYIALAVTVVLLLATVLTGTANATTTYITPAMKPPLKGCRWEFPASVFTERYYGCYCPPGMHVAYPPKWEIWKGEPFCARNKK